MNPTRSLYTLALVSALAAACKRNQANAAQTHSTASEQALAEMTVDALSAMIDGHQSVAVFDANGRPRYEEGHIPGARYVGHDTITAEMLPQDRATPLVFYCYNER